MISINCGLVNVCMISAQFHSFHSPGVLFIIFFFGNQKSDCEDIKKSLSFGAMFPQTVKCPKRSPIITAITTHNMTIFLLNLKSELSRMDKQSQTITSIVLFMRDFITFFYSLVKYYLVILYIA